MVSATRHGRPAAGPGARCRAPGSRAKGGRCPGAAALRKEMSNRALWATSTASRDELQERRQYRLDARRAARPSPSVMPVSTWMNAGIGSPGLDQGLELAEHLAAAHLHRTELGDRARGRAAAGGLEVDDDEGQVGQRGAQIVQRALDRLCPHASHGSHDRRQGSAGALRTDGSPTVRCVLGRGLSVLASRVAASSDEGGTMADREARHEGARGTQPEGQQHDQHRRSTGGAAARRPVRRQPDARGRWTVIHCPVREVRCADCVVTALAGCRSWSSRQRSGTARPRWPLKPTPPRASTRRSGPTPARAVPLAGCRSTRPSDEQSTCSSGPDCCRRRTRPGSPPRGSHGPLLRGVVWPAERYTARCRSNAVSPRSPLAYHRWVSGGPSDRGLPTARRDSSVRLAMALATASALALSACASGGGTASSSASSGSGLPSSATASSANAPIPSLTISTDDLPLTPTPSPSSTPDLTAAVTSATTVLLAARAKALASADKAAWMATVADSASAYGVRQAGVYDAMSALRLRGWQVKSVEDVHAVTAAGAGSSTASTSAPLSTSTLGTTATSSTPASTGSSAPPASTVSAAPPQTPSSRSDWQATVTQTYSIAGFDAAPRTYRTVLTLRPAHAGHWVAGHWPTTASTRPARRPALGPRPGPRRLAQQGPVVRPLPPLRASAIRSLGIYPALRWCGPDRRSWSATNRGPCCGST